MLIDRFVVLIVRVLVAIVLVVVGLVGVDALVVDAQTGSIQWSDPVNVSESLEAAAHPAILADAYGVVHLFWSESSGTQRGSANEGGAMPLDTIMYRRWDGEAWSGSVSVLAVPGDPLADFVSVAIDDDGIIHATWTGLIDTYYSWAPSWKAHDVYAWARPVIIAGNNARTMRESSIAVSPSGDVHIIYATRGPGTGVAHVVLRQDATMWSRPVPISAPLDPLELGYANVRLIVDDAGRLHATWQTFESQGFGQAIYYSRSVDGGVSWSTPFMFRYREEGDRWVEWPYLTVDGDDLYVIYVNGTNIGRGFRLSQDGGETWSETQQVFEELEGINGYVIPLVDAEGQMHVIANMRTRTQIGGIFYSQWIGNGFTPAVPVVLEGHTDISSEAHYTAAAVRLGNELHLVWNEINGGEIWYIRGVIEGVKSVVPETIPEQLQATTMPSGTSAVPATEAVQPTAVLDEARNLWPSEATGSPAQIKSTWSSVFAATVPAALLIVGALVWKLSNR